MEKAPLGKEIPSYHFQTVNACTPRLEVKCSMPAITVSTHTSGTSFRAQKVTCFEESGWVVSCHECSAGLFSLLMWVAFCDQEGQVPGEGS